jgi:hypothetical protein
LFFCDNSFAAASAPVRAARNTGFDDDFAIIAIEILSPAPAFAPGVPAPAAGLSAADPPPHAIATTPTVASAAARHTFRVVIPLSML